MPDWTYHPLRPITTALLGARRSQRLALRALGTLAARPAGARAIAWVFDHPRVPEELVGRFGASVPAEVARDARRALTVQGAGVIEVREPGIDPDDDAIRLTGPSVADAVRALDDPAATVLAMPSVLLAAGPGWFQRVIEARTPTSPAPTWRDVPANPLRWPGWLWGVLVGIGMILAGLVAAGITLGPVLLWYDRTFLGAGRTDLHAVNDHLVHFLQHDRITMAGTLVATGILYVGLAGGGIRRGWPWARRAYLASGLVGFPTLFYFLATGFVEPLHTFAAIVLFPMFLAAVWRRPARPHWTIRPEGPMGQRRRGHVGQLLMIATGVGLFIGGAVVSTVGLTDVFVLTDLEFLRTDAGLLDAANAHLVPFIAHDRAGFGGALMAAATAITLLSLWGWRRGEAWVWWTLATAATVGFAPAVVVHAVIGYTSLPHLAPVLVGIVLTATALVLARPFLHATDQATGRSRWRLPVDQGIEEIDQPQNNSGKTPS
ncbi:hypothetical protein [Catellatospora tritici]|uniref:hypothetical protein n=1 Tax=Catellatospora tritici TaxID=2851566 RepID=UPI001C2DB331|nr:hypothetical protein [Catellatospora tritici]MBV1853501.1 hypothetical protein [Catellatospora tritici]